MHNGNSVSIVSKSVVILAGGFGTRMGASFPNIPKPLIPVQKVPVLEHLIRECKKYNFCNILILVHHDQEKIIDYFQDGSDWGVSLEYLFEEKPLGTGGALYQCADLVNDDFLIMYADVYSHLNLEDLMNFHIRSGNQITCVTHPNDHPFDSDILETDLNDNLIKVHPYPHQEDAWLPNNVNAALYCGNKKIFTAVVSDEKFDIAQDYLQLLLSLGYKVGAYKTIEYIKDMGTPKRLEKVTSDIKNKIVESRSKEKKKKAIYLDRDGTINVETGYIRKVDNFFLEHGVEHAIAKINSSEFLALCVTNQAVIARGELNIDGLNNVHNKMETLLGRSGAYLDDILFCPHHPDSGFVGEISELKISCICRKPRSGMLETFSKMYNIDNSISFMIGDRFSDVLAGNQVGAMSILLASGAKDKQDQYMVRPFLVLANLNESVQFVIEAYQRVAAITKQIVNLVKENTNIIFIGGTCGLTRIAVASVLQRSLENVTILSSDTKDEQSFSWDKECESKAVLLEKLLSGERTSFKDNCFVDYLDKSFSFGQRNISNQPLIIVEGRHSFKYINSEEIVFPHKQSFYVGGSQLTEVTSESAIGVNGSDIKLLYDNIITTNLVGDDQ